MKLIFADEASTSTSTDAKKKPVSVEQVRAPLGGQLDERKIIFCSEKTSDRKTKLGNLSEIKSCLLEKVEVKVASDNNNNSDTGITIVHDVPTGDAIIEDTASNGTGRNMCAVQDRLGMRVGKEEAEADKKVKLTESSKEEVEKVKSKKRSLAEQFEDCPLCGKLVKNKSLTNHFRFVHKTNRSALTNCNICNVRIAEALLLEHRKSQHPDRFKYDLITCSGCQTKVRAVDFDAHECETEDNESRKFAAEQDVKSELLETCSDCHVVFSGGDMRYHDCKMSSVVRIKKLRPKFGITKTEAKSKFVSDETVKGDENICEGFDNFFDEKQQNKCHKPNVDEKTLLLMSNMKLMRESVIKPMIVASTVISATKQTKEDTSRSLLPGVLLSSLIKNPNLRITRIKDPEKEYKDKKIELRSCLNSAVEKSLDKMNEGGELANIVQITAKVNDLGRLKSTKIVDATWNQNPAIKTEVEISRNFAKKVKPVMNLSAMDTVESRSILTSAILTNEPPQEVRKGEIFKFTVKLLDQNNTSLQIQSVCLTASNTRSSVLQFRLQLVQPDGLVTLQPLWVSICSTDKPAELLKCLVPGLTPCRLTGRGQLQFALSCDKPCADKNCRFKVVVATKQLVLCYSTDMFVL